MDLRQGTYDPTFFIVSHNLVGYLGMQASLASTNRCQLD